MSTELPALVGNPLAVEVATANIGAAAGRRDALIRRYGFAVPTDRALERIAAAAPCGLIEIAAGAAYWARLLSDRGVDVVAYDVAPPPSPDNKWFCGVDPWFPVAASDHTIVRQHAERTLLLVWPTRNEEWATEAVTLFHDHGGERLVYIGEGPGGRTGDDTFHARLGAYPRCYGCAYALADTACVCRVQPLWSLREIVTLPHWPGYNDNLHVYTRRDTAPPSRPRRWRRHR